LGVTDRIAERMRLLSQIVAGLMLVEAATFGAIAFVFYRKQSTRLEQCHKTWGDVIEVKEKNQREGPPTRYPVIRYHDETGKEAVFESKFGRSVWNIKAGDRVEIFANRRNPAESQIANYMVQWGLPTVFGIVSATSIIAAPIVYIVMKR